MNDKCIAAYVREKRPEILNRLDFIMYSLNFYVKEFAKEISQIISQIDPEELKNLLLSEKEEVVE